MSYCINLIADPASPGFGKMLNSIHEIKTFTLNDINIIATLFVLFGHNNKSIYFRFNNWYTNNNIFYLIIIFFTHNL